MDLKCANPICNSEYEYGHGRLLRIQQTLSSEKQPTHWHGVKHYWLCTRCSEKFTIEFQKGTGVLLTEKLEEGAETQPTYTLLQSEMPAQAGGETVAASPDEVQSPAQEEGWRIGTCGSEHGGSCRSSKNGKAGKITMTEEIGTMAGAIWHTLEANGEMTLTKLKKELKAASPMFDWAIGWLAREDKIMLTTEKRTTRVCLKGWHTQSMHAA